MSGNGLPPNAFARGLAACVLACGLLAASVSLLALSLGESRPFGGLAVEPAVSEPRFGATALAARPGTGGWTAVLFWDPGCPCAARSARAADELLSALPRASRLAVVVPGPAFRGRAERRFASLDPVVLEAAAVPMPPSAPALALIDGERRLRYLGPHVLAPRCERPEAGRDGIARLLAILADPAVAVLSPTAVRGCFCPWLAESDPSSSRPTGTRRGLHPPIDS